MRRSVEFIERLTRHGHISSSEEGGLIAAYLQSGAPLVEDWLLEGGHLHPAAVGDVKERFDGANFNCMACRSLVRGAQLKEEVVRCPVCKSTEIRREQLEATESGVIDLSLVATAAIPVEVLGLPAAVPEASPVPKPTVPRKSGGLGKAFSVRDATFLPVSTSLVEGDVIAGQWKLVRFVAASSALETWEGINEGLGRRVEIRVLRQAGQTLQQRLAREARACARMNNPGVVQVFGLAEHKGSMCLVREWIDGHTADEVLRRLRALPIDEVVRVGLACSDGLRAAHHVGVLHRDLKPSSIMIGAERVCISDFGMASLEEEEDSKLTLPGAVLGVPAYTAPEVMSGEPASPAADIYGLGAVLYHLLTGTRPHSSDGNTRIMRPDGNAPFPAASDRRSGVPADLDKLLAAMCGQSDSRPTLDEIHDRLVHIADDIKRDSEPELPTFANDVYLITVPAHFGKAELSKLGEFIEAALAKPPVRIILDLSECEHADARTIDGLMKAGKRLGPNDRIVFTGAPERVRITIEMTGVGDRFEVHEDLTTAMSSIGGGNLVWSMLDAAE